MTSPLNTAPGPSPDEESARNIAISRRLLQQAQEELDREDILQASEKAWGAAAHAIKSVAEKRRWFSDADWKLAKVVSILTEEQGDITILGNYSAARGAHFNFYHHEFDSRQVQQALDAASELISKLEAILANENAPAPYVNETLQAEIHHLEQPTSARDRLRLEQGRIPIDQRPPVPPESSAAGA
jgi:uncharacterized protein (UPF0332 family)